MADQQVGQPATGGAMRTEVASLVANGPILAAILVAGLAGLTSFLSPCVLPLVPAYLSYVTGLVGMDLASGRRRGRVVAGTVLFVAGFAAVFIPVSVLAVRVARFWADWRSVRILAGLLIVALGLAFLGLLPWLHRQWGLRRLPAAGLAGAPVFGAAFALSWTPCVGPTLGAVLALAATGGSTGRAIVLASAYCAGIGLPFLGVGLGLGWTLGAVGWIRRRGAWVTRLGGALLILVGLALASGLWADFARFLQTRS